MELCLFSSYSIKLLFFFWIECSKTHTVRSILVMNKLAEVIKINSRTFGRFVGSVHISSTALMTHLVDCLLLRINKHLIRHIVTLLQIYFGFINSDPLALAPHSNAHSNEHTHTHRNILSLSIAFIFLSMMRPSIIKRPSRLHAQLNKHNSN